MLAHQSLLLMPQSTQQQLEDDEEDVVSKSIGEFGKWQLQHTFLLSLVNIPCTWHIFAPTFHAYDRDTWCSRSNKFQDVLPSLWKNLTQPHDYCEIRNVWSSNISAGNFSEQINQLPLIPCTDWEFAGEGETIISEFNLVCDRKKLINLAEMMFLAGVAIGGLVCGILSDKYGRKKTLMTSILLQTILGIAVAFAPWFELYICLRAVLGFISCSVVFTGFVLSIELVGGQWRTVAGISYLFPVSLSYITIAGIAYLIHDWHQLQLAISLPGIIFLGLWWILPESPRWLLALGRTNDVITILNQAAKRNGRVLPPNIENQLMKNTVDEVEDAGVKDLFRTHEMRKRSFLSFFIWFSVYIVYYGLVLNLGNIGGNLYINSVLIGAVELPAVAVSILILLKRGRRWPMALTMILSGLACGLAIPIGLISNKLQWVITTLTMISKFSISSSNAIMPVLTAELYPTTIRNIGVGAANVSAGIALMLVPYLWESASMHHSVPMSILTIFGVFGGLAVLFLPETGFGPLKDTLEAEEHTSEIRPVNNNYNCCATT